MQIEQQRIPAGDIHLNVRSAGTGPTVLLLHGFPDSGEMWNEVTHLLAASGYRVLAPDLRGFGESDAPLGRRHYTLDRIVADLIAILDRLSPGERIRVVGHDWGAVVAWCLSLAYPDRVLSNVVISVGHPREYAVAGLEQKRKGLYTIAWQARGLAEAWLSRGDYTGLRRWVWQHPRVEDCVRSMSRPGRLAAGLNWYRANLMRVMLGSWPPCSVPTLGIWSSGDHFLAEDQMQRSQRRMTAPWEYVRIDGAGHWLPLEQPVRVADLCADWFRRHEASDMSIETRMIEFFFDCSSPWTWLAFHNIQPLARELGVAVRWRPILVGGVFNAVNPSVYEFRSHGPPAKHAYLKKDLRDWARLAGLEIRFPPTVFPVNSVKAMRGCIYLEPAGMLVPFATAVFESYWTRDEDISQDTVLADLCARVGVNPGDFSAGIAQPEIKAQLKANTDELIARGGFGSPTMFVAGDDMYFGNDRLELVRAAVLRSRDGGSPC